MEHINRFQERRVDLVTQSERAQAARGPKSFRAEVKTSKHASN
jgi:hypothetical protein